MKKISFLIMSVLILSLVFVGCSVLNNSGVVPTSEPDSVPSLIKASEGEPDEYLLYADKDWEVGEVLVWNDGEKLCVKYQLNQDILDEDWLITKTHLAVAISKDGIPHNKKGIVQPGQFPYGDDDLAGREYYQECIPFTELEVNGEDTIFIAAHAIIEKPKDENNLSKTAWGAEEGGGTPFVPKGDWATYFNYTIDFTVTYNGNGSTGGTVPSDADNYKKGDSVIVFGNTGKLVKTQDGISLLFTGWNTASDGSGTGYIEDDTFDMESANIILYAQWSVIRGTGPAGGLIFYDKGSVSDDWRYLEAAPYDQTPGIWGCNGTTISGADGTTVGTGKQNTMYIEAAGCTPTAAIAAYICANLSSGSYDDWFLPSKDELNLMYENLHTAANGSVGGFATISPYWSSSEHDDYNAWVQFFGSGSQGARSKGGLINVRAVRAF
jgi:hypothetical protein